MGIISNIFRSEFNGNGTVVINDKTYSGRSITIINGHVTVDGVAQDKLESFNVSVYVGGNPEEVSTISGNITVSGNVGGDVKTTSGDICCGDVDGSVKTTSGDVECAQIAGSVHTVSGDISHT